MTLTVLEALKLPVMKTSTLLAGQGGLLRTIKWVTVVEVIEDVTRLQEGEFLVTTAYGIETDEMRKSQFINQLASRKLSGIAIQTGFYLKSIPDEFIESANLHQVPLIELPSNLNFSMVTQELLEQVVNAQFQTLEHSYNVNSELVRMVLQGENLDVITDALSGWTHADVFIFDAHHFLLAANARHKRLNTDAEAAEVLKLVEPIVLQRGQIDKLAGTSEFLPVEIDGREILVCPIVAKQQRLGLLVCRKVLGESLGEWDKLTIGHGATVCALELLKEQQIRETETRLTADFVSDLLSPQKVLDPHFQELAKHYNLSLTTPHQVTLAAKPLATAPMPFSHNHWPLYNAICDAFHERNVHFLVKEEVHFFIFVIEAHTDTLEHLKAAFQTLSERAEHTDGQSVQFAMGLPYENIEHISTSYQEALRTLRFAPAFPDQGAVHSWQDLRPYEFLMRQIESNLPMDSLVERTLGPVLKEPYLLETLRVFLATNGNYKETSLRLFIHRHTLRYRIEKIEWLTKKDINNADHRFQLQIALLGVKLMQCPPLLA